MAKKKPSVPRREFIRNGLRGACLLGLGGVAGLMADRTGKGHTVWQIDPSKCTQCGNCATYCVLTPSAVKCVHAFVMCGYCELCTGYFEPEPNALNTGAENQLCPTGALRRKFVEDPYFEYTIDEALCIGCGKCVEGCNAFGNGSLFLQVRHDRCVHCNECSIAAACPSEAFVRVPAELPYLLKDVVREDAIEEVAQGGPARPAAVVAARSWLGRRAVPPAGLRVRLHLPGDDDPAGPGGRA